MLHIAPPCTGTAITPGTLTSAQYTQSFSYDTLNRLTSGPLGSYTYGDSNHLHAATSVGTGVGQYTASYDASGNMVCRAPTGSTTCAGSNTGQQLGWDNEGRLTSWQNAPSSPTSTAQYLYDGEGNRVEQQATTGGTSTTTVYVGSLESVATTGGTTTTTTYYYAAGQRIALAVNGTLSYLAGDLLGSATVALDTSGTPTASQLYAPYGGTRYSNGTMPTDYGFTGQRTDAATGLDYYGARYYDPTLGQFTSADTVLAGGLNRYAYVGGNPISHTDPSGHDAYAPDMHSTQSGMTESPTSGGGVLPLPPPPDLGPLIKTIGMLIGMAVADVSTWVSIPTALSPGYTPTDTGSWAWNSRKANAFRNTWYGSEMPDGTPVFNQRTAPKSTPAKSKPTGSGSQGAPQTQTGGAGAGGTFGGGDGAAPGSPGDDDCGCWFTKLYRAIGPNEDISKGLFPRQPGRNMSPAGHITNGSSPNFKGSQFISTSLIPELAMKYGSNVVEIEVSLVQGQILDVSTGGIEYGIIPGSRAWYYAQSDLEVLIDGWVPPEAIKPWTPEPGC